MLANVLPETGFMFGAAPSSIDAGIYGFIASIFYFDIDTPLKAYLLSRNNLVAHCQAVPRADGPIELTHYASGTTDAGFIGWARQHLQSGAAVGRGSAASPISWQALRSRCARPSRRGPAR